MLAGMSHRRKAGAAETRFRGMNADAGTRRRPAPRNPAYSASKTSFFPRRARVKLKFARTGKSAIVDGMKYCVIGLGIFGRHLCTHLASLGAEVLAIDPREENVAAIKDVVDAAVELDVTDPVPFAQFPIKEMDAVVIAIGDNFEASMMLTLRMQELGAKKIICRVLSPMHERLLKLLKVDRLVVPEEFAARGLAHSMMISGVVDGYDLGDGHVIIEATVPAGLIGKTLEQVALSFRKYSILLVTVKRLVAHPLLGKVLPISDGDLDDDDRATLGVPKIDVEFKADDVLVLFGAEKNLPRFLDAVSRPGPVSSLSPESKA